MGKWYGSIENRLEENKNLNGEKVVGGLLTEFSYSDRHPYEIVKVENQKSIWIRELGHKKTDNESYSNNWELYQDETNQVQHLVYRYNRWYKKYVNGLTGKTKYSQASITFGYAEYYYDYEF